MTIPASALLLAAIASPEPTDITPLSLAIRPHAIERESAPYDWSRQRVRSEKGVQVAQTAACDTGPTPTNIGGKADQVPDCRFD